MQPVQVEEHVQQYSYGVTFDDRLGAALDAHEDTTEREAKRLAFYIFWNVKLEFTRCCCCRTAAPHSQLLPACCCVGAQASAPADGSVLAGTTSLPRISSAFCRRERQRKHSRCRTPVWCLRSRQSCHGAVASLWRKYSEMP